LNSVSPLIHDMGTETKMDISMPAQINEKNQYGDYVYKTHEQKNSAHNIGVSFSDEIAMHLGSLDGQTEMIFEDVNSETQILSLFRYIEQFGEDLDNNLTSDLPAEDSRPDILHHKAYSHSIDNLFHFIEQIPEDRMSFQTKIFILMRIKNEEMTSYSKALVNYMYNQVGISRKEAETFAETLESLIFLQSEFKASNPDKQIDDSSVRATPSWKWAD